MSYSGNMRRNNMNNNQMPGRGGPLMTDHLQDLELELELLKRKRQLIQRQQSNMLYNRPGRSLDGGISASLLDDVRYNQPSQSYNDRFDEPQHLNFSHLYNDNSRNNQAFGLKRQAQDWSGSPGNNMGGQKRSRPNPFVQPFQNNSQQNFQHSGFMPQPLLSTPKPKPLMNFPVQRNRPANRPNKQAQGPKPLTHHPNFKQNRPGNRPGGPANRPAGPANRAAGFSNRPTGPANRPTGPVNANQPPGFVPKKNASPKKPSQNNSFESTPKTKNVFMANKRPNNKMNGRLELALGMIVKEIKVTYENKPEYKGVFSFGPLSRLMKQSIRERLHTAMVGKVVDKASDIMAEYRQKFPLSTDKEIVELAVIEQKKNDQKLEIAITLLEEGDPEQYFKLNMTKLVQVRFDEMMGKLAKMITDENEVTTAEILEHLPEIKKEPHVATPSSGTEKTAENESAEGDTVTETTQANGETAAPNGETAAPNDETAAPNDETAAPNDETAAPNDEPTAPNAETAPENAAEEPQTTEKPAKADGETPAQENDIPSDISSKESMYDKWLSLYIQRKLPGLLNRHKTNLLKVFDLDKMFKNTRAAITINTNNKAQAMKGGMKNASEQGKDDPELPRNLPHFAKVLASPSMPKRKIMQEFLNQFNPKTIKRHKKNYNLLFIGFDTKENYDKFLAADQTIIGTSTLSIMGNVTKPTTNQSDTDIDQVLTPQLDDQINDLLNSIRKADEEAKTNDDSVTDIDLTHDESQETSNVEETNTTETSKPVTDESATNETENAPEVIDGNGGDTDAVNSSEAASDDIQVIESSEDNVVTIEDDEVAPLKSDEKKPAPATPAKGRAPATPRSVNTRRSSRLQN